MAEWVAQRPNLERDGVVRWRCVDLQRRIQAEFAVTLHEHTVGKLLHKLSFRRVSVRPQHPQTEPEDQADPTTPAQPCTVCRRDGKRQLDEASGSTKQLVRVTDSTTRLSQQLSNDVPIVVIGEFPISICPHA